MNSLAKSRNLYNIYLADFLKTNRRKFAVICLKKASKGTFMKPEKLQNQSSEGGKEEKKKSNGFLVFIRVTLEMAHFDRLAEFFTNN